MSEQGILKHWRSLLTDHRATPETIRINFKEALDRTEALEAENEELRSKLFWYEQMANMLLAFPAMKEARTKLMVCASKILKDENDV